MDTDSLFVSEEGRNKLEVFIDEKQLGKLKVEDCSSVLNIRAPKDYTFGDEVKMKGIKVNIYNITYDKNGERKKGTVKSAVELNDQQVIFKTRNKYLGAEDINIEGVILNSHQLDDNTFSNIVFPKLNSFIRQGQFNHYQTFWRTKHLYRQYKKGEVLVDGTVTPYVLNEF
jgi:hypothetical protein